MSWERDSDREENTDHKFLREGSHERPAKRRGLRGADAPETVAPTRTSVNGELRENYREDPKSW